MNHVGLRFNTKTGSFFMVQVSCEEAEAYLLKFRSGQDEIIGGVAPDNTVWAMRLADVAFVHSFNWEQYQLELRAQQLQQGLPIEYSLSGTKPLRRT